MCLRSAACFVSLFLLRKREQLRSIVMSMSVCGSVCLSVRISQESRARDLCQFFEHVLYVRGFSDVKLKEVIGLAVKAVRVVPSQRSAAEQEQAILEFAEACRTDVMPTGGFPGIDLPYSMCLGIIIMFVTVIL